MQGTKLCLNSYFLGFALSAIRVANAHDFPLDKLHELEELFDERFINTEPTFEKAVEYAIMEWKRRKFKGDFNGNLNG